MTRKHYRVMLENVDLGCTDDGPFRSLELDTYGDTYEECWESAYITECDQDGGQVRDYPAADLGGKRYDCVDRIILEALADAAESDRDARDEQRYEDRLEEARERRREPV